MKKAKQRIVTIGGGTGSFTLLSGLKNYPVELSAIVSMADDGGSTGILRDELGVLPPGDIRQCLVALSESSKILRELFNYRYAGGGLSGHSFGNIFISTLEKISGNFNQAIKEAGKILRIKGKVIPVTLRNTKLTALLNSGKKIIGQHNIDESDLTNLKRLHLVPRAETNPEAVRKIMEADKIIINPGNFFCSVIPNFLTKGLTEAIVKSKAKKIYVCNLMTKLGHSDNFTTVDFISNINKYAGSDIVEYVIYNTESPEERLIKKYSRKGEYFVETGDIDSFKNIKFIGKELLSHKVYKQKKSDKIKRTLIRHDSAKTAEAILMI